MHKTLKYLVTLTLFFFIYASHATASTPMKTYSNKTAGLTIDFPSDWETKTNFLNTAFVSRSPQHSPIDTFQENVSVITENLALPLTAHQYFEANLKSMRNILKNLTVHSSTPINFNGVPAIKLISSYVLPQGRVKALQYFFTRGLKGYVITCTATRTSFKKFQEPFETIAHSLKWAR